MMAVGQSVSRGGDYGGGVRNSDWGVGGNDGRGSIAVRVGVGVGCGDWEGLNSDGGVRNCDRGGGGNQGGGVSNGRPDVAGAGGSNNHSKDYL